MFQVFGHVIEPEQKIHHVFSLGVFNSMVDAQLTSVLWAASQANDVSRGDVDECGEIIKKLFHWTVRTRMDRNVVNTTRFEFSNAYVTIAFEINECVFDVPSTTHMLIEG